MDYESRLNKTILEVKPSGIRRFFDIVSDMEDVISLSIGEPDFRTPWHVSRAAIESLEKGRTWYTPNRGFEKLRVEIADFVKRKYELNYAPKTEILVTVGGSEALDLAMRCLLNPGDEVLIHQPSFVCYEPLTLMTGAVPKIIDTKKENSFRLTSQELEAAITDKTKLLILSYPNNPTGAVMRKADLEALAEVIIKHDLLVISDEIYSELTYSGKHVSMGAIEGMRERTVVINGFSKAFAMTGWRLGYAMGPATIIEMMTKLHQYGIMSAPTVAQYAAIEALKNGDKDIEKMRGEYEMRRRYVVGEFNAMGLTCFEPFGAFYSFPCIKSTGLTSEEFCTKLLESKRVAIVPGNAFGESGEGFVRVSYSYSLKHLREAISRIREFLQEL
ncbi:MAG: aminotransferase class I/II-fold pyridoxal phosphate-dependent enzyme [Oscillospiraceae bacterium]|nr:aminotransferase class I/II-fold pyridoxal phosphate-dependent enzyme [Oscillospiraceae bacterium]